MNFYSNRNKNSKESLRELRLKILQAAYNAGSGHIPSSYSILEILYGIIIEYPSRTGKKLNQDFEFILSKGHSALALYAIYNEIGIIGAECIENFSKFDSNFGGHPDLLKNPSFGASTGSLGHGLPIALGKILGNRALGKQNLFFCVIGDGELNEGSIWESLLVAAHRKLSELIIILDSNQSSNRAIKYNNINETISNLGFHTLEIDGHNLTQICDAISNKSNTKPNFVIATTVKGYGINEMENNVAWHHRTLEKSDFIKFIKELK